MREEDIVQFAKQRFEQEVHTPEYRKIHADSNHLENLLQLMDIRENKTYLDLGTGNGYIAFELAKRFPSIFVTGLDIAEGAIETNTQIATQEHLVNVKFETYQGTNFPFPDGSFYGIISRYALHHFPNIRLSVNEMGRTLESHGFVIISDPAPYDEDIVEFYNAFQALKQDGHVRAYKTEELSRIFEQAGFTREKHFFSYVTYPRELISAYTMLFEQTPPEILEKYNIELQEQHVFVTARIFNVMFRKRG